METLKECKIECLMTEKVRFFPCPLPLSIFLSLCPVTYLFLISTFSTTSPPCLQDIYLYYFLLRYPGRTLVFLASVDGIRRMLPLFEFLGLPVWPLHSQMEQRQRLKNLDR